MRIAGAHRQLYRDHRHLRVGPFLGVSAKKETAWNMGLATLFVMLVSSASAYDINWLLTTLELEFLRLICCPSSMTVAPPRPR